MGYDTFGLFRGWCTKVPSCLEYKNEGEPTDAADVGALRCARCRCLPQEHAIAQAEGYDPHSEDSLAQRRKFDVRLLPPAERAASFKVKADAAFKERNFRTAYLEYTRAIEATPDDHVLLGNRCQAYLKVGKNEAALRDAEAATSLAPEWPKGQYRLGTCLARAERHEEAVTAFERAHELEPTGETKRTLFDARKALGVWRTLQEDLAKARKRSTIRAASDMKAEAEFAAKVRARPAAWRSGGEHRGGGCRGDERPATPKP